MALDMDDPEQTSDDEKQSGRRAAIIVLVLFVALLWWLLSQFGRVPDVVGLTPTDARSTIEKSGFEAGTISEDAEADRTGRVIEQSERVGSWILKGGQIDLVVSPAADAPQAVSDAPTDDAPSYVTTTPEIDRSDEEQPMTATAGSDYIPSTPDLGPQVPAVQGLSEASAVTVLETAGYRVEISYRTSNTSVPSGEVFYQDPPPDAYEPLGTLVEIDVSTGPPSPDNS